MKFSPLVLVLYLVVLLYTAVHAADGVSCLQTECTCYTKEKVIYHQTMTPSWLEAHASYINGNPSQTKEHLTFTQFNSDSQYAALLKVPMVPAGVLQNSAPLTVKIVASHDVATNGNNKIQYGVSDGITFVGFSAVNHGNFGSYHPCVGAHGFSGVPLKPIPSGYIPRELSDSFFPGQVVLTLKLDERWGSCYTAHDGGFVQTTAYFNRLMLNKGLTLEVYKVSPGSTVGIKFIEVTILEDN